MKKLLFSTSNDAGLALIRIALGVVMFPHGAQKVLSWFGGYGWTGSMGWFTGQLGIPAVFAVLAILAEFLGSLGLITGLFGRIAAFGIFCNMVVAVYLVHAKVGFFMNWNLTPGRGEGFEFHILAAAMALLIIWKGSGAYSVDRVIAKQV
ncbi:MAG: DoxX family protein [Gemmatimonadota bacterium]